MKYLATFHTHFGAMSFLKKMQKRGDQPVMMPVPRSLSASCGVCVQFTMAFEPAWADEDLDCVYEDEQDTYTKIFDNDD